MHLHLFGDDIQRAGVAGGPGAGEKLLGGRMRLDVLERLDQARVVGGRKADVEPLLAALGGVVAGEGGMGLAGQEDFLDSGGHGALLGVESLIEFD
ncbi:hypothetical protein D3C77_691100 [compost metagenome]